MAPRQMDSVQTAGWGAEGGRLSRTNVVRMMNRDELFLKYQPKLDLESGRVSGVEALIRWRHPLHGVLEPDHFIPMAEKAGTIGLLDTWAIEEACRQIRAWQDCGEFSGSVAVNICSLDLSQPRFVDAVQQSLQRHGIHPWRLILEITETTAVQDVGRTLKALHGLDEIGVRVSLDDFGTGYSSLASLKALPISEVKLDKGFIREIAYCPKDVAIVTAVVTMAKALGASVVAEGVETARQLATLAGIGCGAVQGYLIGRPMEPKELVRRIAELEMVIELHDESTAPMAPWPVVVGGLA